MSCFSLEQFLVLVYYVRLSRAVQKMGRAITNALGETDGDIYEAPAVIPRDTQIIYSRVAIHAGNALHDFIHGQLPDIPPQVHL